MSDNIDGRGVTVSVKIYGRLLAAYPADFRREYGPAMKQLFRDQCRDAWRAGRGWGLAVLWLRVLPDWAKTSVVERFADLREREPIFIRVFSVAFLGALICSAFAAFSTRPTFSSTATIEINTNTSFLPTQFKILSSYRILTNVIINLRLNEKLAQQKGAKNWTLDETYDYLVHGYSVKHIGMTNIIEMRLDDKLALQSAAGDWTRIRPIKYLLNRFSAGPIVPSNLIRISVINQDPNLAANIANSTLGAYRDYWDLGSALNAITIDNLAKPDLNSVVQTRSGLFLGWLFWGTLLALLAGGVGAWLADQRSAR
jgi:capsular polysaccharide biosynthesis protein